MTHKQKKNTLQKQNKKKKKKQKETQGVFFKIVLCVYQIDFVQQFFDILR